MFAHPVAAGGGRRKAQVRRDLLLHDAVHPCRLDVFGPRFVDELLNCPAGALADQVREVEFAASRPAGEELERAVTPVLTADRRQRVLDDVRALVAEISLARDEELVQRRIKHVEQVLRARFRAGAGLLPLLPAAQGQQAQMHREREGKTFQYLDPPLPHREAAAVTVLGEDPQMGHAVVATPVAAGVRAPRRDQHRAVGADGEDPVPERVFARSRQAQQHFAPRMALHDELLLRRRLAPLRGGGHDLADAAPGGVEQRGFELRRVISQHWCIHSQV